MTGLATASVVVCTRNRAHLLEGSLMSLLGQTSSVEWQLILVDNGSTDETSAVVERCRSSVPGVELSHIVEMRPGLSHARNRGIAAAEGEYLLFTDDDVVVDPRWVDELCAGFSSNEVVAVGGRVLPSWPAPPPRWLAGPLTGLLAITHLGEEPRDLTDDEVPMGANMAIRASALDRREALFDPRLGHRGNTFFAHEELELFRALHAHGRLVYRPTAVVHHRISPDRMTWEGMRRAATQNGFGARRADRLGGAAGVPLRNSISALGRSYLEARRQSRRNGARENVSPEAAFEEVRAYWALGRWIEVVFGAHRFAEWLVTRVA
jgi:glycosyltransferase involved in cell wall biosynthesis